MRYRFSNCELDTKLVELRRRDKLISVEPQVFRLLCLLIEKRDTALSKEDILSEIWGNRVVSESSLSSCIKAARQAIGDSGEKQLLIKTIRGFGFRFVGTIDAQLSPKENTNSHQQNIPDIKEQHENLASRITQKKYANPISGRSNELARFKKLECDCIEQYSQVVLLSGAAGVGKTRLLEEVTCDAETQGFIVLWGRCREESGAPAYWPWRHLLLGHFRNQTLITAEEFPELANLLPELFKEKNYEINIGQFTDDQYRYRLFQSIATLITLALKEQSLFLVFDDLHQADHASLSLLEYVVSELDQPGLFIVGTYRDVELHDTHRFLQTVSELSRLQKFNSIHLKHLNSESVGEWARHSLNDCTPKLIETIMSKTDGHPLYVSETIRHLKQGGSADELPISLKAIISQRFSRLPSSCVEVMRAASVIGRRFDVSELSAITGLKPTNILSELDHAVLAGQVNLADTPGKYQFSHIIVRETLYDSLLNSDRLHLHCNFTEYLEENQAESGELAFHFHQAAPLVNASKATFYARKAAEEANQLLAFEISVKYYQLALRSAKKEEELALLLSLGQSQIKSGENINAVKTMEKVLLLSEQTQKHSEYALAAIGIEEALWRPGISSSILVSALTKALDNLGNHDKELKIVVIVALIRAQMMCGDIAKDKALLQQAKKILLKVDEPLSEARVLLAELYTSFIKKPTQELFEIRMEKSSRAIDIATQCGDDFLMTEILSWRMQDFFVCGRISEVESFLHQQLRHGLATKQPFFRYYLMMWQSLLCMARGELSESEQHANSAINISKWLPGLDGEGVYGLQMFSIKREQGSTQGLLHLVNKFVSETTKSNHWNPGLALIYSDIGELDKARVLYQSLLSNKLKDLPPDSMWLACIAYLSEVCYQLKDEAGAKILYEALLPHKGFNILVGANITTFGLVDRYLGLLSFVNKQYRLAELHLQNAVKQNEAQGLLLCANHAKFNLAQLLLTCQRLENCLVPLEDVIRFTQKAGMKFLHGEAIQLKESVKQLPTDLKTDPNALSRRETQVLKQIALGASNKGIAEKLFISESTVAAHIRNIFEKTGAKSRTEAAFIAIQANKSSVQDNN